MTLSLAFSLADQSAAHPVTGLSRGNVTLTGEQGRVSSAGHTPDQSVLVFLAIVDLLDGLSVLLSRPHADEWEWIGHDSSFQVVFRRRDGRVAVEAMRQPIGDATDSELARAAWQATSGFAAEHRLPPSDLAYSDLRSALEEFHDRFLAWVDR
jgi:hypothetical protein